jgi:hypothetical protein
VRVGRRGAPLAALLLALAVVATGCGGGSKSSASGTTTTVNLASRVQTYVVPSRNHVTTHVTYPQNPPVGGDHNPVWMNCGVYSSPVVIEAAVHSMEHGAVWIVYRPDLPKAQVDTLVRLVRGKPYVLLSPWADTSIPAPIVASAWGLQLKAESASDPAIAAFVKMYAGGPQAPEPGAPCSGGFGTPQ